MDKNRIYFFKKISRPGPSLAQPTTVLLLAQPGPDEQAMRTRVCGGDSLPILL